MTNTSIELIRAAKDNNSDFIKIAKKLSEYHQKAEKTAADELNYNNLLSRLKGNCKEQGLINNSIEMLRKR
jgi:aminoglycoside phosphotransferase family enzyme